MRPAELQDEQHGGALLEEQLERPNDARAPLVGENQTPACRMALLAAALALLQGASYAVVSRVHKVSSREDGKLESRFHRLDQYSRLQWRCCEGRCCEGTLTLAPLQPRNKRPCERADKP